MLRIYKRGGCGKRIGFPVLGKNRGSQGFEALFLGHGGPGPSLGTVGKVNILQNRHGAGSLDFLLQPIGEQVPFMERLEDALSAFVQLRHLAQAIPDCGDGHLIEGAGRLLSVPCDKRNRCILGKKPGRCFDLFRFDVQFPGNRDKVFFNHRGLLSIVSGSWSMVGRGLSVHHVSVFSLFQHSIIPLFPSVLLYSLFCLLHLLGVTVNLFTMW